MHPVLLRLAEGSPNGIGAAREVAAEVLEAPALAAVLVDGLTDASRGVRTRSAWALDRASRERPGLLAPHAAALLDAADTDPPGPGLRRLLPLLLARLDLGLDDARRVESYARRRLADGAIAAQANALEALAAMARLHSEIEARPALETALDAPAPAVRARARRLLERLDRASRP